MQWKYMTFQKTFEMIFIERRKEKSLCILVVGDDNQILYLILFENAISFSTLVSLYKTHCIQDLPLNSLGLWRCIYFRCILVINTIFSGSMGGVPDLIKSLLCYRFSCIVFLCRSAEEISLSSIIISRVPVLHYYFKSSVSNLIGLTFHFSAHFCNSPYF